MKHILLATFLLISTSWLNIEAQSVNVKTQSDGGVELPFNRMLQPAGILISMGDSTKESHALDCALSPDSKWLAVEERYSLVFINTANNKVEHTLRLEEIPELKSCMNT